MTWVRLDDHFDENPKIAQIGPYGIALWVTALAYCNRNLTDGFIPWSVARKLVSWEWLEPDDQPELLTDDELAAPKRLLTASFSCGMHGEDVESAYVIKLLVCAGLWDEVDGGYQVHDYADFQPTKAQVEAERAQKQAAGQAGGVAAAQAKRQRALQQNPSTSPSKALAKSKPVPVPDPLTSSPPARGEIADLYWRHMGHEATQAIKDELESILAIHPKECVDWVLSEVGASKDRSWRICRFKFNDCMTLNQHGPRTNPKATAYGSRPPSAQRPPSEPENTRGVNTGAGLVVMTLEQEYALERARKAAGG